MVSSSAAASPAPPAPRPKAPVPVAITYPDTGRPTGIARYSVELARAIDGAVAYPLRGREFRIGGRKVGGILSWELARARPIFGGKLVHSGGQTMAHRQSKVVTVHDIMPLKFPELNRGSQSLRILRHHLKTATKARAVLTDTRHVAADVERILGVPPERIRTIPLGIDHDLFRPDPSALERARLERAGRGRIMVVAVASPHKRVDVVVEAAALLGENVEVVHVGHRESGGPLEERLRAAAAKLGDRYVHRPSVTDAELRHLLQTSDVLASPSRDEGFGFPPLEAIAAGCAVAVSDIPPHRENLGPHAAYFDVEDVATAAKALEAALKAARDPGKQAAGHEHVRRTFTWERCARETVAVYEDIVRGVL